MQKQKFLKIALTAAAAAVGIWLFVTVFLGLTLPFLLAFLLALVTEKPCLYLMEKARLPRWAAGGICTLAAFFLLFLAFRFLWGVLLRELAPLLRDLPAVLGALAEPLGRLQDRLLALAARLPEGLAPAAQTALTDLFSGGAGLLQALPGKALAFLTAAAKKIPKLALFTVTTVLASFMTAARLPALRKALSRALPAPWRQRVTVLWRRLGGAMGGWLKAQGKLFAVTLCISFLGLLLLGQKAPWRAAPLIALVDALPVFGSGAVLLPWAAVRFLKGNTAAGAGLAALYGAVAMTRATLEPRLVGRQMGMPPLLTLAALYIGGRLCGVGGLVLFPILTAAAVQVIRWSGLGKASPP